MAAALNTAPADVRERVEWLDGIRGAAAMFVVLHHSWLAVWPQFPRNAGPWWAGWMLYGHLAVAVFIVVSGFSLALAPARRGERLSGGTREFIRRRAWRILPPYWAALIFSTLLTALVLQPHPAAGAVTRGFVVHGLLLQDVVGSFTPNGTFWSIAVEWQIYFVFPLILLLARRTGMRAAVAATVSIVLLVQAVAGLGSPFSKLHHLTPQFLALFALGVLAVKLGRCEQVARRRRSLTALALAAFALVAAGAVIGGSEWMVSRYFWVDLLFGAGVACAMAAMHGGGWARLRAILSSRPALRIGLFSYSIYLLHGPLVGVVDQDVLHPMHLSPLVAFAVLLLVVVPAILAVCYGFHVLFEAPFIRCRGMSAVRTMPGVSQLLACARGLRMPRRAATPSEVALNEAP